MAGNMNEPTWNTFQTADELKAQVSQYRELWGETTATVDRMRLAIERWRDAGAAREESGEESVVMEYEAAEQALIAFALATHCPTCESPNPKFHPATGIEGEVTSICPDSWHSPAAGGGD